MTSTSLYTIGGCPFRLAGSALEEAVAAMPGFQPFRTEKAPSEMFRIQYVTRQDIPPARKILYRFSTEGISSTLSASDSGYVLHMSQKNGTQLYLWGDADGQLLQLQGELCPQLLRFALWIAYGLGTATHGRIAVHSSCIVHGDRAYLFLGESGTGKSTHTRLWREHIAGSLLLNDDSPILAVETDGIWIYGSPWSGKTPCYQAKRYRLGGCVRLSQAPYNRMERLSVFQAYAALHPSCPPQFACDETLYNGISESLNAVLGSIPVYRLACRPDAEAARLSYQTLCGRAEL